jgi:2'-5' RNA ligase
VRFFVALEITSEVRENLVALMEALRSISTEPRWVRPGNLHVTLKFLGEMPKTKLEAVRTALGEIRSEQPVMLEFRGLGFFPNEKHPRVFWAGIEASTNLMKLAGDIEGAMENLGIPREQRPFSPHLTLGRFERPGIPEKLRCVIGENAQRDFGTLRTHEFHLIQSKLKPSGAEYTTLASFPFAVVGA